MIWKLCIVVLVVVIAIFFKSDADLPLVFLPYQPENSFDGKVVWITGASSGIGAALAEDMVRAGAKVIISARRVAQLEQVADKCASIGERPMILPLDVTDYEAQQVAYDQVIEKFGHIDSLVLNAGASQRNLAVDTPFEVTENLVKLNFLSFVAFTKLALPGMIKRKSGQLVVMSSLSGVIGTPLGSTYSATKFALHGYFNALRAEVDMYNIGVTIICPGPVESEISAKAHRNPNNPVGVEGEKMPTARCTLLVAKAMYYRLYEAWISDQPYLLVTYLAEYMPGLTRLLFSKVLGPARTRALKSGANVYDIKQVLKS